MPSREFRSEDHAIPNRDMWRWTSAFSESRAERLRIEALLKMAVTLYGFADEAVIRRPTPCCVSVDFSDGTKAGTIFPNAGGKPYGVLISGMYMQHSCYQADATLGCASSARLFAKQSQNS